MVVLGKDSFPFDRVQDQTCDVVPFDPSLGTSQSIPIVDGALAYDCPYQNKTFVLVFHNALYISHLDHNLLPLFILREANVEVNDKAKIHASDPSIEDHSIYVQDHDLRIPLQLNGIFSYFHTRCPSPDELEHCQKVIMTPEGFSWDPYSTHFSTNEESMLDFNGDLHAESFRKRHCPGVAEITAISTDVYDAAVDSVFEPDLPSEEIPCIFHSNSMPQAEVSSFASALTSTCIDSKMKISLGTTSTQETTCPLFATNPKVSSTASKPNGVTPAFLAKIWHIKHDEAVNTLKQSSQVQHQGSGNALSRHFSTNDRMLRYRRLDSMFYTNTFFVTKAGKSTRGFTCAQLFVTDKGYVALYPMKTKGDFHLALKQFCKDVGVPLRLVCDPSGEQSSKKVKHFCHLVGTTLRFIEESTQWANRAELYVGLFKESVRQDLRRTNSPMSL